MIDLPGRITQNKLWKKALLISVVILFFVFTACGPSESELLLTAIPVTQTAVAQEEREKKKDEFEKCHDKFSKESSRLVDAGFECKDLECKQKAYDEMLDLIDEYSVSCRAPDWCTQQIKSANVNLIKAEANYIHSAPLEFTDYESVKIEEYLSEQISEARLDLSYAYGDCFSALSP